MQARLKWYLPSIQISLALLLGYLGSVQFAKKANGGILLDYVAPAEYALHIINMPAALAIAAITRNSEFRIGLEHSSWGFLFYVFLIGLLWHLIGRSFSLPREREADGSSSILWDLMLLLYCLACIVISVMPLFRPLSVLFGFAAFAWDGALLVLVGRRWYHRYKDSREKTVSA